MRIGVLTGGGDCPGLNAAIRAVVRRGIGGGHHMLGIRHGWAGLLGNAEVFPLAAPEVSGILHVGGTILGSSRTNPTRSEDLMNQVVANLERHDVGALIVIGGDDTLSVAAALCTRGWPVVGIPKTIDNDVWGTEYCIGFNTAVTIVADVLDRLHTTASAHNQVMVLEVMGREAGWVATLGGLAGGADFIVIPEATRDIAEVCRHVAKRRAAGKTFSLIVVSEAAAIDGIVEAPVQEKDAFGHIRLDKRNVGETLAREIERRTGIETRAIALGRLQRGGSPTVLDRIMATRLGAAAVDFVEAGRFGVMTAVRGEQIVPVPLGEIVGRNRRVDLDLYSLSQVFF
ncbi:MAG: 6-phosphofructokinase [Chloroflexi bacterium]|nr:6-phosphofructokinase [Chloroflexota bacterium]